MLALALALALVLELELEPVLGPLAVSGHHPCLLLGCKRHPLGACVCTSGMTGIAPFVKAQKG